tara:strand:- start:278 stop:3649 length:3372 start_codon:yes stop_codon:yes gene_type:complete
MKGLFQDATSFNQNIRNWKINEELPKSRTMFKGADAFNIKEYDPFLNKISKERNVDTSTANLSPDDKRTFSKIKKLIITKDTDQIDMAVELITSLNNSSIFKTLLDGCKLIQVESNYSDGGIESKLVTNKLFTGSGPAQPYLNYALMSIIANVPNNDDIQIDDSLKIKNITELNLSSISFKHDYNYCKKPDLSHFIYLRKLTIEDPNNNNHPISIKNISIIKLICKNFSGSLKFLSDLPQLKYLDLDISTYSGDTIQDLESFRDLVNLKELNLESGGKLQNINFLSSCKKLEYLNLSLKDRYSSEFKIDDIEAISDLQNLEELVIGTIEQDFRISHIGECKNLKKLYLKFDDGCVNYDLSELNSCTELTDLKIEGGSPYEINAHVDSINGISQPKNIKAFSIAGNWRNGLKIERLGKEDVTLNDENEIKIVNEDRLSDIGIVSHYMGEPFNGIMYKTTTVPFSNKRVVGEDYEMVDGLKHGSSKCFYNSQNINVKPSIEIYDNALKSIVDIGAPMLEYKYEDDEFDKIIGFYDQYGNNYVKKDQCVFAKSLSYDSESEKFYFNGNVYSGQVLVHKYASHYRPSQSMGNKMISLYEIIESAEDQEGDFWGGYISFLININDGKLTGEFCAASTSNTFFSGNTNEKGCKNTIDKMMVKKLSSNKSNALTLENKSVVVTGIFENYSRNELKTLITSKGGKPSSSVTSNTFLILGGSKIGPKKKNLANELGIKIIDINSFIEEFINKSEDNNLVNESLFIDVFFPLEAKKEKITTNKLNPEDKKTFTKIKSLLQTRDFDKVDMGIELLRSINITEFYETLLTDCKIIIQDSQKVLKNKFFTGSGPAQPYLNYALYLLIYHCPEEAEIDDSLKRNNIKILETDILFNHNYELQYRLPEIEKLTSLNELIIDLKAFDLNKINFSDILKSSSVQKIRILNPEKSLIWLKNLPQLKIMELDNDAFSKTTKDHNVFEYLINLEELKINASRLENIDFLKKCVKIKKLILDLDGKYSSDLVVTKNINTLKYLTDLKELTLTASPKSKNILSYEGLSNCKNLKILDIRANVSDEVLTNIKDCSSLEKIDFLSKADFDIRLNISNLNGLNKLDKLKKIYLDGVNLLESNSKLFVD